MRLGLRPIVTSLISIDQISAMLDSRLLQHRVGEANQVAPGIIAGERLVGVLERGHATVRKDAQGRSVIIVASNNDCANGFALGSGDLGHVSVSVCLGMIAVAGDNMHPKKFRSLVFQAIVAFA